MIRYSREAGVWLKIRRQLKIFRLRLRMKTPLREFRETLFNWSELNTERSLFTREM